MTIRIGRTLPPSAAPIPLSDVVRALPSCLQHDSDESQFEQKIKQVFGQRHCFLVSSGRAALVLILKALHNLYPERDEVLISAFTCYSVPAAIKKAGMKIRLCDTGIKSLDFDKEQFKRIIETENKEKKILCVLVTHLFGCPADIASIKQIVGGEIPLIEDAAQAMGEEIGNQKLGTLGDIGFFSLDRGKALSTMEGGIIITNREDLGVELAHLAKKNDSYTVSAKFKLAVRTLLTNLLQRPFVFWLPKALPFLRLGETIYDEDFHIRMMSSYQISLSRNWQERLQQHQKIRRKNIQLMRQNIPENFTLFFSSQENISLIKLPVLAPSQKKREMICLRSNDIGCGVMSAYPTTINEIPKIASEFIRQSYPNAKILADCLLTLPVHEYVRESDRKKIGNLLTV